MNVEEPVNSKINYKSLTIDTNPDQESLNHFAHGEKVAEVAKCHRNALRVWAETSSLVIYVPTWNKKVVSIKEE